ncbi:Fur family transcriptional regulator [Desulforhopalus sp. 52FAK]
MEQLPNMRLTTQRQIILEELGKVTSHPTANEVYDMVRKRLPRIGLGTVYRNLELMADSGVILKLEVGGTQKRFDATVAPHYHIRCSSCGKVDDVHIEVQHHIDQLAKDASNYEILGHHIEFTGVCHDCQENEQEQVAVN